MKHFAFLLVLVASVIQINAQELLTNKDIWYSRTFKMDYVSGFRSMNDGAHYSELVYGEAGTSIIKYAYSSGKEIASIVSSADIEGRSIDDYQFSADEQKILIATDQESIYRHSSRANYLLFDLATRSYESLGDPDMGKTRLAEYSPDGSKVAFVRNNDLYYYDIESKQETRITLDGVPNAIINGATDWVYEEEFGFDKGFYWSENGSYIAYYRFDESEVKQFQMAMYGSLYPEQYTFKYPKAGEANAKVDIYIYTLGAGTAQRIELGPEEHYVPRIKWTTNDHVLSITRMNRHQNELSLLKADTRSARGPIITPTVYYTESSKTYLEISDDLVFVNDKGEFLMTSDKDGYNHIYLFSSEGKQLRQLTKGPWDVIEFIGYDATKKVLYYTSSETATTDINAYRISLSGKGKMRLSPQDGTNSVDFSADYSNFLVYHSDANSPYDISLYSNTKGKPVKVRELVDNKQLAQTMERYKFQDKQFFQFDTERGDKLNGWMITPPDFDKTKQYPVLLAIYGGPGHNTVTNSFGGSNYYWHQMLAQKGYIVASVDPRGTYYRGRDFKNSTYLQLGNLETEDMISTAKHLASLDYVDGERIGMQGWSFGGYLTSSCLTKGADHFKMGIAVAPVTNWRFYDTIYTERFMRTPQENEDGYDENSPINHVDKLKAPYLLVHGSADDNVHYQNTMEMIDALVQANKQFDLFIYPNKNHSIYGGTTRLHLYTKMTAFIEENL